MNACAWRCHESKLLTLADYGKLQRARVATQVGIDEHPREHEHAQKCHFISAIVHLLFTMLDHMAWSYKRPQELNNLCIGQECPLFSQCMAMPAPNHTSPFAGDHAAGHMFESMNCVNSDMWEKP